MFHENHYFSRGTNPAWNCFQDQTISYTLSRVSPFRTPIVCALLHLDGRIVVEPSAFAAWLLIFHNKKANLTACFMEFPAVRGYTEQEYYFFFFQRNPLQVPLREIELKIDSLATFISFAAAWMDGYSFIKFPSLSNWRIGTWQACPFDIAFFILSDCVVSRRFSNLLFARFPSIWSIYLGQ